MNEQFEKSLVRRKRRLSRFICQEMLCDFLEDKLDHDRRQAVEESLDQHKDAKQEMEEIRRGLVYVELLSRASVADSKLAEIRDQKRGVELALDKVAWRNWPEVWRWGSEAVAVALIVAFVITILPVKKLANLWPKPGTDLVLAQVERPADSAAEALAEEEAVTPKPPREMPSPATPTPLMNKAPPAEPKLVPEAVPKHPPVTGPPAPLRAETKAAVVQDSRVEAEENIGRPMSGSSATGKKPSGFVYRAFMSTETLDETTGRVTEVILSLGGEKAGQVDLGWRKPTGSYFHFSLPESNYEGLLEQLRSLGPVRIYKDPHWRVMPEGQIRLILFVEGVSQNP